MSRKLATIRIISELEPIEGADFIEVAKIDGWQVVVKKGEFNVNDKILYLEVDSWVPHELAPFLCKTKDPKEYMGVKGEKLRTVKLRGQLSQGLVLDLHKIMSYDQAHCLPIGEDMTEALNIQLWERPVASCLAGQVRGSFPLFIPKTDQERIQNLKSYFNEYPELEFEITEKLDGSSCTIYNKMNDPEVGVDHDFGVCSRNLDLAEDINNSFWKMARRYCLKDILRDLKLSVAIQGELIGEGIQGNKYKLKDQDLRVFDIYDIDKRRHLTSSERLEILGRINVHSYDWYYKENGIKTPVLNSVPLLGTLKLKDFTFESLLAFAEDISKLTNTPREGIVCKSNELVGSRTISFKVISNKFLFCNQD